MNRPTRISYENDIKRALSELASTKREFNPYVDNNYLLELAKRKREAKRAYDEAVANSIINNGGKLSSYAIYAASQAKNENMKDIDKLAESIMKNKMMYTDKIYQDKKTIIDDLLKLEKMSIDNYNADLKAYQKEIELSKKQGSSGGRGGKKAKNKKLVNALGSIKQLFTKEKYIR